MDTSNHQLENKMAKITFTWQQLCVCMYDTKKNKNSKMCRTLDKDNYMPSLRDFLKRLE